MKLTKDIIKKLIKEEMDRMLQENPLAGDTKTAATPEDEKPTVAPNPLAGDTKTAATPEDEKPTAAPNPLASDGTAAPLETTVYRLGNRVADIEKIIRQMVAKLK